MKEYFSILIAYILAFVMYYFGMVQGVALVENALLLILIVVNSLVLACSLMMVQGKMEKDAMLKFVVASLPGGLLQYLRISINIFHIVALMYFDYFFTALFIVVCQVPYYLATKTMKDIFIEEGVDMESVKL